MTVKVFLLGVLFLLEPITLITHKLSAEGNKELSFNKHPCSENSLIHVTDTKDFRSDPRINTVTRHIFLKEFLKFLVRAEFRYLSMCSFEEHLFYRFVKQEA